MSLLDVGAIALAIAPSLPQISKQLQSKLDEVRAGVSGCRQHVSPTFLDFRLQIGHRQWKDFQKPTSGSHLDHTVRGLSHRLLVRTISRRYA